MLPCHLLPPLVPHKRAEHPTDDEWQEDEACAPKHDGATEAPRQHCKERVNKPAYTECSEHRWLKLLVQQRKQDCDYNCEVEVEQSRD